ncbi:MAG: 50S ribosomal protein L13 [Candidatus Nealsonbacteria bacterium RIFCSPHIGHO2_01_FULL_43_31]|uniref:Large ribosomal subunit protein uL13 n=2 Tax=Candidatus Nealsoniibacteriota TaxID=1817911 RepID=A0A1G2E8N0_9BACT|nr:MAG: 50S ribosomal protein L13 [Candidatus Nealsonbacteria bacterium RIFCSPHIGHO2_01_FULL_43_31]OGZ22204.1 MAG: 50S ribosomal protein L13 [Candidatus Nealsonbacteria bacterium RIFCSPHIGHO2_02_FULL_43_13]OGZ25101.1 MAG: 50S ribosomal protein L13 [Candidatus Nealsonbacteria bacterium RIFCSPLOWO2_01_FULL_43_36]
MKRQTLTIDAEAQSIGRIAVKIALALRGKHRPNYQPNQDLGDFVVVKNIAKVKFTGKKLEKKKYYHHTSYSGGLRAVPMKKIWSQNPAEVLKKAVWGMLPKNKLRSEQIKRLKCQ